MLTGDCMNSMKIYLSQFFLLVFCFFPYGGNYLYSSVGVILGVFFYRKHLYIDRGFFWAIYACYLGVALVLLVQLPVMIQLWDLRQVVYFLLIPILAFGSFGLNEKILLIFKYQLSILIAVDLLVVNLDIFNISDEILRLVANDVFLELIGNYYRYIGVLGNPNTSGILYALVLYFFLFCGGGNIYFRYVFAGVAFYLLLMTVSRTALISVAIPIIVFSKNRIVLAVFFCILYFGMYYSGDNSGFSEVVDSRVTDFSSGEDRVEIFKSAFEKMSIVEIFFGSPKIPDVTDNDYLTIFVRFGGVGLVMYLSIIAICVQHWILKCRYDLNSQRIGLILILLISGLGGGGLGSPQLIFTTFLLNVFWIRGAYKNIKII